MAARRNVPPMWLDHGPAQIAQADQIRARTIDALRQATYALVFAEGPDEGRRVYAVCEGVVGEVNSFFLASLSQCLTFVAEATGVPERVLAAGLLLEATKDDPTDGDEEAT